MNEVLSNLVYNNKIYFQFLTGKEGMFNNFKNQDYTMDLELQDYYNQTLAIYTLVSLLGFMGNLLILMALMRKRNQNTTVNFLIGNLAFSDILIVLFCSPFTLTSVLLDQWMFGKVMCHIMPFLQCVSVLVSTLILISIAIVRYHMIKHPISNNLTANHGYFLVATVWTLGFAICSPLPVFHSLVELRETFGSALLSSKYLCVESWPSDSYRIAFTISLLLVQYILPLVCLTISHTSVCRSISKISSRQSLKHTSRKIRLCEKSALFIELTILILVFAVSWMPLHLFHVVTDFNDNLISNRHFKLVYCICHLLGMMSCCLNPILYGFLNNGIKAEL
uniref:Neuropeptide Y receptor type 5 n=1 Tax=Myotis lucifugus TaxID=59463 RepID=G1PJN2_MYOLU